MNAGDLMNFIQTILAVVMAVSPLAWNLQKRLTQLETKMDLVAGGEIQKQVDSLDRRVYRVELNAGVKVNEGA